jgi:predicted  nucleic acid-binding Zn-ribbon protein
MAYRCVHCSGIYEDGSNEILTGCTKCKSKFFFYIRNEKLKEILANKEMPELTTHEINQVENDVRDIAGIKDEESPVFLDFESVKVLKPGKYLLDLTKLFAMNRPRVYQLDDGKYIVDLAPKKKDEEDN